MEITDPSKDNSRRITFKKSFGNKLEILTRSIENWSKVKTGLMRFLCKMLSTDFVRSRQRVSGWGQGEPGLQRPCPGDC